MNDIDKKHMDQQNEQGLVGGRSSVEVVRIENTVHRSLGPRSDFTHALLQQLEAKGFNFAPRFLGIDDKGREILTFIEGEVSHQELKWTDEQLKQIAKIIRQFHDATAGSDLAGIEEVVCHNDLAPWNIVLNEDMPIAFIDYDDAAPGNRADDLGYYIWTFLELGSDVPVEIQAQKIKVICAAYEFDNPSKLLNAIQKQQKKILEKREALTQSGGTEEERKFSADRAIAIRLEMEWVIRNREYIEHAIA